MSSKFLRLIHTVDRAPKEITDALELHKEALFRLETAEAQIKAWTDELEKQKILEARLQARLVRLVDEVKKEELSNVKPEVLEGKE
jgi:Txe/YoeB family toxin of Txe-Axe toxin-antitoxin module